MGYRDPGTGLFARKSTALRAQRREFAREAGRLMQGSLRRHAPRSQPRPDKKNTSGLFANGIRYRSRETERGVEVIFYASGPHAFVLPFLIHGTKPHVIPTGGAAAQRAKGYPLRFFWEKGPSGPGIYRYWSVNHPGTKPDPFVQEALDDVGGQVLAIAQRGARQALFYGT